MEDYLDLHAPQWIDFTETHSPIRMQDFFEKTHAIHERIENLCDSTSENTKNVQPASDNTDVDAKVQAELDSIKSTPIKISPKHNKEAVEETTYDRVFNDAMRTLNLCKKSHKTREALNKTTQDSNIFKTPNISKIAKSSRSVGCRSIPNKYIQPGQSSTPKITKVNKSIHVSGNDTSVNTKETSVDHASFKQNEIHTENDTSKESNVLSDDSKDKKEKQEKGKEEDNEECNEKYEKDIKKCNETDDEEHNEEDDKVPQDESKKSSDSKETMEGNSRDDVDAAIEKGNQTQSLGKHSAFLTWYNHRPSSKQKRRMSSANKKYVSLAEAVSRFQNETPERFHTRSSKANMSLNMSKVMQNRLKSTIPISPALISKNRTRPVTVLSREDREKLEMEEMKKHQIKANPIPPNVLRGYSRASKTSVAKKPTAAAHTSVTESNKRVYSTSSLQLKSPLSHHGKGSSRPKNMVTKLLVTDPSGFTIEHEEITFFGVPTKDNSVTKNVTRIVPFSFEARNKDLQMKKEQRLKSLQEASKMKTEFHARPVPNFSKPPTPVKPQQQNTKKSILQCPFSFDDRDKKIPEKKEKLVKQVLGETERARMFRANPAPIFKPVMIRGRSKENILTKKKNTKIASEQAEDQENKEPNVESSKLERKNIQKEKNTVSMVDKQKAPLKAYPLKLNTDKRAKKRHEFNEKMRCKEMEDEANRQEAEKKRLESEKMMETKLRKLTIVKAKPMPAYKPPLIIKATKQLTDPQSPAFASKFRSKQI